MSDSKEEHKPLLMEGGNGEAIPSAPPPKPEDPPPYMEVPSAPQACEDNTTSIHLYIYYYICNTYSAYKCRKISFHLPEYKS